MILEFTFLGLSLTTIAALLVHKEYEVEKGQQFRSHEWLRKADGFLHTTIIAWKRILVENAKLAFRGIVLMIKSIAHAVSLLILSRIHDGVVKAIENMKGKNVKRPINKGSVSFFLKHIEAEKKI